MQVTKGVLTFMLVTTVFLVAASPAGTAISPIRLSLESEAPQSTKVPVAETPTLQQVPARVRINIPKPKPAVSAPARTASAPSRTYSGNGADIIRQVAAQQGCSGEEVSMLLHIATKESSLRVNAVSKTGKYVGLFQLGPHLGSYDERIDPYWNTSRAIRYMRGRYGSIAAAYQFRNANNWY